MKGMRLYFIGGAILVVLYLVSQYYRPRQIDWNASYLKEDKIPFGTYILNKELPSILPNTKILLSNQHVYNTLKNRGYKNAIYLMVAGKLNLDALDYRELVKFMNNGNQVFIAAFDPGSKLTKELKLDIKSVPDILKRNIAVLNFVNPKLRGKNGYVFDQGIGSRYFSKLDTARAAILGKNERGDVNFVKYSFGKGALYLLPDPKLLSNYSLLHPDGATYAGKVLSYLPAGQTLIWDELHTRGNTGDASILRVLFKHAPLRWAYLISIISLLIFVLFEVKRRQRMIPIMAPLKNASLDFVRVVGKVYYQQRDNRDIARKKILYFLDFLRTKYRLNINRNEEDLIKNVALRSGASEETLQQLFAAIARIEPVGNLSNPADSRKINEVSDDQLIELNKHIEEFYKQV